MGGYRSAWFNASVRREAFWVWAVWHVAWADSLDLKRKTLELKLTSWEANVEWSRRCLLKAATSSAY